MKYTILFCLLAITITFPKKASSQNIDNASFDSLCVCAIDRIWDWVTSDTYYFISDTAQPFVPNQLYDSSVMDVHMAWNTVGINYDADLIHYTNSVKLYTRPNLVYSNGEIFRGFIANGNHFYTDNNGYMDFSKGGSPFPYRPSSIKGMYQFEDSLSAVDDFGQVIVLLKKYNPLTNSIDTIGYVNNTTELNPTTSWSTYEIPINYLSNEIPDSIVVMFISSSIGAAPTTLWLDGTNFDFTIEIDEFSNNNEINIFPNPVTDYLFISNCEDEDCYCCITDIAGKTLSATQLSSKIDLSKYTPGIYFITISNKSGVSKTFRVIKN